jgi:hypothetical protein
MLSISVRGAFEYRGAIKVAMLERTARLRKPLCERRTLENMSDKCTVEAMDDSMELAVP